MSCFDEVKLRGLIRFVHYNKQKAKHVIEAAKMVERNFRGKTPTVKDQMVRLPGIGPMLSSVMVTVTPSKSEWDQKHSKGHGGTQTS